MVGIWYEKDSELEKAWQNVVDMECANRIVKHGVERQWKTGLCVEEKLTTKCCSSRHPHFQIHWHLQLSISAWMIQQQDQRQWKILQWLYFLSENTFLSIVMVRQPKDINKLSFSTVTVNCWQRTGSKEQVWQYDRWPIRADCNQDETQKAFSKIDRCKHVAYYSPPNVHIYSLLAEQLCCSVMSLMLFS